MTMIMGGVEVEPSWQDKPTDPIRAVLRELCGGSEPPDYVKGYDYRQLTDEQYHELTEWALAHSRVHWSTGIGIIEAAEKIVAEAVSNGNIPGPDSKWRLLDPSGLTVELLQKGRIKRATVAFRRGRKTQAFIAETKIEFQRIVTSYTIVSGKTLADTVPVDDDHKYGFDTELDVARAASRFNEREREVARRLAAQDLRRRIRAKKPNAAS